MSFYHLASWGESAIRCVSIWILHETAKAAYHALGGKGVVLSYAMSERLMNAE